MEESRAGQGYGQLLDSVVTRVHNSAIRSALESLPESKDTIHRFGHIQVGEIIKVCHQCSSDGGYDHCRAETEKKLQSLLVKE